jgi:hypothetical protein
MPVATGSACFPEPDFSADIDIHASMVFHPQEELFDWMRGDGVAVASVL